LGRHQLINAAVGVGVIEALRLQNIAIDLDSIREGLYDTVWPGRLEVVLKNPLVVMDGAQNVASSRALKEAIQKAFKYEKLILVLGISQDKDARGICNELSSLSDKIILTKAKNPRATQPESLARYFPDKDTQITNDAKEAIEKAISSAKKKDLVLCSGSLFVVGEARALLLRKFDRPDVAGQIEKKHKMYA